MNRMMELHCISFDFEIKNIRKREVLVLDHLTKGSTLSGTDSEPFLWPASGDYSRISPILSVDTGAPKHSYSGRRVTSILTSEWHSLHGLLLRLRPKCVVLGMFFTAIAFTSLRVVAQENAPPAPPAIGQYVKITGDDTTVPLTFDSITLDLALLLKLRGDEYFIQAGQEGAETAARQYAVAIGEIKKINRDRLPSTGRNVLALLQQDIEYRQLLLANKLSFWGGVRFLTPALPIQIEKEFKDNIKELESVVNEIYDLSRFQIAEERNSADATAKEIKSSADVAVKRVEGEIAALQGSESRLSRQDSMARMQSLRSQREKVEAEMEQASKALSAAQRSVNGALLSAAASYAGLPPGTADSIVSGDIKSAVVKYATSESFLNSPELASAAKQLGTVGTQLTEAVHTVNDVRKNLDDAEFARSAIRNPSLENMSRLGERAWSRLPPESREAIAKRVTEQAPVKAVMGLTRDAQRIYGAATVNIDAIRNGVAAAISDASSLPTLSDAEVNEAISRLSTKEVALRSGVTTMLKEVGAEIQENTKSAKRAADLYIRFCAKDVVANLISQDRAAVDQLKKALKVDDDEALVSRLSESAADVASHFQLEGTRLLLKRAGRGVTVGDLSVLLRQLGDESLTSNSERLRIVLASVSTSLTAESAAMRKLVLRNLDTGSLEKIANRSLEGLAPPELKRVWDRTMREAQAQMPGADQWAVNEVAKLAIGETTGQALIDAKVNSSELPALTFDETPRAARSAGNDAAARALALKALDAAFPGVGSAAQAVISTVEGMAEMDKQIENMQRLSQASRSLFMEEAQLAASLNPSLLQEAIANKQLQIARLQEQASQQQADLYSQIVVASGNETKDLWARVKMRRPLAFYRAELLRQQYSLLDESIGIWTGTQTKLGRNIERMVRNDPQNLRLALDSEIDLYGWFNRDLEGSRTDLDQLVVHWRQLETVSNEALAVVSGRAGGTPLGNVQSTDRVSVRTLLTPGSDDARAFESWLRQPSKSMTVRFLISPLQRFFGTGARNVRIVDVGLTAVTTESSPQRLAVVNSSLKHPGTALVSNASPAVIDAVPRPYRWEVLVPANLSITKQTEEVNAPRYPTPFRGQGEGTRGSLEGYSPYTVWQLSVGDAYRTLPTLADLEIRFAYFSIDDDAIVTEQDYLGSLERNRATTPDAIWVQNYFPVPWYQWVARRNQRRPIGLSDAEAAMLLDFAPSVAISSQQQPSGIASCALTGRAIPSSMRSDCPPPVDVVVLKHCLPKAMISASLYDYYRSDEFVKGSNPKDSQICPRDPGGSQGDGESLALRLQNASRLAQCAMDRLEGAKLCAR